MLILPFVRHGIQAQIMSAIMELKLKMGSSNESPYSSSSRRPLSERTHSPARESGVPNRAAVARWGASRTEGPCAYLKKDQALHYLTPRTNNNASLIPRAIPSRRTRKTSRTSTVSGAEGEGSAPLLPPEENWILVNQKTAEQIPLPHKKCNAE
jgi:hypothetical protein